MTTPNPKATCEHYRHGANFAPVSQIRPIVSNQQIVAVTCTECGAKWVPADVLEEARRDLAEQRLWLETNRLLIDEFNHPENTDAAMARLAAALARIDALLGPRGKEG